MGECLCELLQLNMTAGLGRRLADAEIAQDPLNPNRFYILYRRGSVAEISLAHALSVRAATMQLTHLSFKPMRA